MLLNKIMSAFRLGLRKLRTSTYRKNICNSNFSLFCNNCIGAMFLHDLHERFNSPTVNLFIPPKEYVQFLSNLQFNLQQNIKDVTNGNSYPIGLLNGSIHLHFVHYHTFDDAVRKWNERKLRINYENTYVILIERDGCDYETMEEFDRLPFDNKCIIVHKDYPNLRSAIKVNGYENLKEVGRLDKWDGYWGKKYYDKIDWISFLNKKR